MKHYNNRYKSLHKYIKVPQIISIISKKILQQKDENIKQNQGK